VLEAERASVLRREREAVSAKESGAPDTRPARTRIVLMVMICIMKEGREVLTEEEEEDKV